MYNQFWDIAYSGILYDLLKAAIVSILVTCGFIAFLKKVVDKLKTNKEIWGFAAVSFVCLFVLISVIQPNTAQSPRLTGTIQTAQSGALGGNVNTISVLTMSVVNSGSMPSVATNWKAQLSIDNQSIEGSFMSPLPKEFTFFEQNPKPGMASAIKYHGDDDLLTKASSAAIPIGGMVAGTLFVVFPNLDAKAISTGALYIVTYQDALGREYRSEIKIAAQPAPAHLSPGVHADLSCPIPPQAPPPNGNFSPVPGTANP